MIRLNNLSGLVLHELGMWLMAVGLAFFASVAIYRLTGVLGQVIGFFSDFASGVG